MIQELIKQRNLLQLEYDYERAQFQRETENMGVERKVNAGLCWHPVLVGRDYYNSLDELVLEITRSTPFSQENDSQFEPGRPVCFFRQDASGMLTYLRFVAQVSYAETDRLVVIMPNADAVQQVRSAECIGIQLYFDEYTYRLMFSALDAVIAAKGNRLAELRDIIHTSMPARRSHALPVRLPWLNPSQEAAVNEVLWAKDVAVVHGPPGTGKTTTLVEAIYETLRREAQVLVCAQSNMAVDWIAQKLSERGVNVLRIGNPTRVSDEMLADTYERRFESHPLYTQLWAVRRTMRQLYESSHGSRESLHQKIARLRDRAHELEYEIRESLFNEARVVACTLTGSANPLLLNRRFGSLFIDEAAQALEASCWIAIQRADRVILAGDHRQLPPTIKCPEALRGGLDATLMQAIADNKPAHVSLLTVQYRMSEDIMQFPNQEFYEGRLTSDSSVRYRSILDWEVPIEWVESGEEAQEQEAGLSHQNKAEAVQTLKTLREYIEKIGPDRVRYERMDIGIISPYKAQIRLLRQLLRDGFWKPFRSLITVGTVDGFQGQERDIIVISMVRSNEDGKVGFLHDLRRMNVAMTRARMKLFIVGDSRTLCRHPFYRRLHSYIENLWD